MRVGANVDVELLKRKSVRMDGRDIGGNGVTTKGIVLSFYGHGKQRKKGRRVTLFKSARNASDRRESKTRERARRVKTHLFGRGRRERGSGGPGRREAGSRR